MGETQIRACQDVKYRYEGYVSNPRMGEVYSTISSAEEPVCVESQAGVLNPRADAKSQLAQLLEGKMKECGPNNRECLSMELVGKVRTEVVKSWYDRLSEFFAGLLAKKTGASEERIDRVWCEDLKPGEYRRGCPLP